jgi:hypothetical protein
LFEYPNVVDFYQTPFLLGLEDGGADRKLALWNARNSRDKQCRLIFAVYRNESLDTAMKQENYWQGGNKNEFIVAIGLNDENKVNWCHIISWTERELLKAEVRDYIAQQETFDLMKSIDWVGEKVKSDFVRKRFRDFNYLTVEPPIWAVVFAYFLILVANGVTLYCIAKDNLTTAYHCNIRKNKWST